MTPLINITEFSERKGMFLFVCVFSTETKIMAPFRLKLLYLWNITEDKCIWTRMHGQDGNELKKVFSHV